MAEEGCGWCAQGVYGVRGDPSISNNLIVIRKTSIWAHSLEEAPGPTCGKANHRFMGQEVKIKKGKGCNLTVPPKGLPLMTGTSYPLCFC